MDINTEVGAIDREVGAKRIPAGDGRTVVLRRTYDADVEDVWDAITDPERISRWFLPVTGDLRPGGRYQLKGNASGEILRCEPPTLLKITWVYAPDPTEKDVSEVEVRLRAASDGRTRLELEHAAVVDPQFWAQFGPGAVGVGWDLGLMGLGLHLAGGHIDDPSQWETSAEARQFMTASSRAWGEALRASGASDDEVTAAVAGTTAFYVAEPDSAAGEAPAEGTGTTAPPR